MSVGVGEFVGVEDHAAELLERQAPGPVRVDRLARAGRVGDQVAGLPIQEAESIAASSPGVGGREKASRKARSTCFEGSSPASLTSRAARCRDCRLTKSPLSKVSAWGATLVTFRRGVDRVVSQKSSTSIIGTTSERFTKA